MQTKTRPEPDKTVVSTKVSWNPITYLKNKIRVQGKAWSGEKAQHTRQYVSILNRFATPPWALRLFLRRL